MSEVLSKKDFDKVLPIIEVLEKKGYITPREAENVCGRSSATVRRYLGILIDTGSVAVEGNTNNSGYSYRNKTPTRQSGGLSGGMDGGLAEKIIELIQADSTITVLAIAETLDIPKRTIEREMKKLRDRGIVVREGGNRYGRWIIKQED